MKRRWRGIYSLHKPLHITSQTRLDRMVKLGLTDLAKLVTVRVFGGTDMQLGRTDMVRVRA